MNAISWIANDPATITIILAGIISIAYVVASQRPRKRVVALIMAIAVVVSLLIPTHTHNNQALSNQGMVILGSARSESALDRPERPASTETGETVYYTPEGVKNGLAGLAASFANNQPQTVVGKLNQTHFKSLGEVLSSFGDNEQQKERYIRFILNQTKINKEWLDYTLKLEDTDKTVSMAILINGDMKISDDEARQKVIDKGWINDQQAQNLLIIRTKAVYNSYLGKDGEYHSYVDATPYVTLLLGVFKNSPDEAVSFIKVDCGNIITAYTPPPAKPSQPIKPPNPTPTEPKIPITPKKTMMEVSIIKHFRGEGTRPEYIMFDIYIDGKLRDTVKVFAQQNWIGNFTYETKSLNSVINVTEREVPGYSLFSVNSMKMRSDKIIFTFVNQKKPSGGGGGGQTVQSKSANPNDYPHNPGVGNNQKVDPSMAETTEPKVDWGKAAEVTPPPTQQESQNQQQHQAAVEAANQNTDNTPPANDWSGAISAGNNETSIIDSGNPNGGH